MGGGGPRPPQRAATLLVLVQYFLSWRSKPWLSNKLGPFLPIYVECLERSFGSTIESFQDRNPVKRHSLRNAFFRPFFMKIPGKPQNYIIAIILLTTVLRDSCSGYLTANWIIVLAFDGHNAQYNVTFEYHKQAARIGFGHNRIHGRPKTDGTRMPAVFGGFDTASGRPTGPLRKNRSI